ncbi:unnamed protein product [Rhizophagus irregularis]|nr:unnamed protein product [Rhizophagus irregularis]
MCVIKYPWIIIPKKPYIFIHSNFKDKQYVITSPEICKALYDHYDKNTKDIIVNVIKNFAKIAGSPLASKLVENEGSEKLPVQELTLKELKHKQFREIDEISSGCYNIPDSPNFKSIDAIVPECDGIHYLYQMTIAENIVQR